MNKGDEYLNNYLFFFKLFPIKILGSWSRSYLIFSVAHVAQEPCFIASVSAFCLAYLAGSLTNFPYNSDSRSNRFSRYTHENPKLLTS